MGSGGCLTGVALTDLEILSRALSSKRIQALDAASLQSVALGHLVGHLGPLRDASAEVAQAALQVLIADRCHRPAPHLELVWTGPEAGLRPARDTAVVVRELFSRARQRVVVGGFRFDHGEAILQPLYRAMRDCEVQATFFLDIPRAPHGADPDRHAADALDRFYRDNWPFGDPRPAVYYDPRTVEPGSLASLHAKCLVIDSRLSLVTSANFTDRGQRRNLEAGVLIDDVTFASRLTEQWMGLIESGHMRPYRPA